MRVSTQFPIAVHALLMVGTFKDVKVTSEMVAGSADTSGSAFRRKKAGCRFGWRTTA